MPWPFYPLTKGSRCLLNKGLGGPKSWSDILEKRKSDAPARIQTLDNPAHSLVTILTVLSWLPSDGKAEIKFSLYTKKRRCGDRAAQILNLSTGWR